MSKHILGFFEGRDPKGYKRYVLDRQLAQEKTRQLEGRVTDENAQIRSKTDDAPPTVNVSHEKVPFER